MSSKLDSGISRRRFLIATSMAATVGLLAPRDLFAQDDGLVQTARKTAATANTTVQKLRGNVSVLMGAGGNRRPSWSRGKLLIDAGYATNDRKPDRRDRRKPSRPAARFLAHSSSTLANQSLYCFHAESNPEIFWSNFGAI
jgi:hypothetical protein